MTTDELESELDRVMVDIETLGLERGAAIISIGACRFSPRIGWERDEFYTEISIESNQAHGLHVDPETMEWWEQQDADLAPLDGDADLDVALEDFRAWLGEPDELWANSPKFDMSMLEAGYEAIGSDVPWAYYQLRDVRTVRNLPGAVELQMHGDEHHALDDARHQADEIAEMLNQVGVLAA